MIRIRGEFRAGSPSYPIIRALVVLPRLAKTRIVEFLIDTGADSTTLHPVDTRQMGIRFRKHFEGIPMGSMRGIGGKSPYWEELAEIQLLHDGSVEMDVVTLPIQIAKPTRANSIFESLLGRDVLQHYKFTCHPARDFLTLERPS